MNARMVGRPEADEIPSHYVGYIKRVPELDPVIVGAAQIEDTATLKTSAKLKGDAVGRGRIVGISLDALDVDAGGRINHIPLGAVVEGTLPQHRVTKLSPRPAGPDELSGLFEDAMVGW